MRTGKNQHNPGTAPATVSEFKPIIQPLRFDVGRRLAGRYILVSPETGLKSLISIAVGDAVAAGRFSVPACFFLRVLF